MKPWSELLDSFMLGTRDSAAADLPPERELLQQLALVGAYRRAGYAASTVRTLPEIDPAPPEMLPACSLNAAEWLTRVSGHAYSRELSLDWFLFMHQHGRRMPHTVLPYVLKLATQHPSWAPYIAPVLGARGRWMVERSDTYPMLQAPDLWDGSERPPLNAAEIDPKNTALLELRQQMMEGLAYE